MALDPVLPIAGPPGDPVAVTAEQWRRLDVATTMAHDGHDVAARAGVTAGLGASVAGMTVTVAPGSGIVTPAVTVNGSYRVSVSSSTAVTLSARDATYSRHDLVVARVRDSAVDASGQYAASVEVVTGVPSAAPVPPSVPAGALALWVAIVPPSGTVTLVDRRTYTAALGGVITCTSSTRPAGGSLRPGQVIFETDTSVVQVWTGAAWQVVSEPVREYWRLQTADQAITAAANTQVASSQLKATIPAGTYAFSALILAQSNDPAGQACIVGWGNATYSGGIIGPSTSTPGLEGPGSWRSMAIAQAGTVRFGTGQGTTGSPGIFHGHFSTPGGEVGLTFGRSGATYQILIKYGSHLRLWRVS